MPKPDYVSEGRFNEEVFMEVRDKRLATLLAQEVIDNEDTWINYEQEEAEVKIDVADMVLEQLVGESVELIKGLEKNRDRKAAAA